jgi:hypothetical protein
MLHLARKTWHYVIIELTLVSVNARLIALARGYRGLSPKPPFLYAFGKDINLWEFLCEGPGPF